MQLHLTIAALQCGVLVQTFPAQSNAANINGMTCVCAKRFNANAFLMIIYYAAWSYYRTRYSMKLYDFPHTHTKNEKKRMNTQLYRRRAYILSLIHTVPFRKFPDCNVTCGSHCTSGIDGTCRKCALRNVHGVLKNSCSCQLEILYSCLNKHATASSITTSANTN